MHNAVETISPSQLARETGGGNGKWERRAASVGLDWWQVLVDLGPLAKGFVRSKMVK